jgi:hypothetical protein
LSIHPVDQWQDESFTFFLFELGPDTPLLREEKTVGAFALFVVKTGSSEPELAAVKLITPEIAGTEVIVEDLIAGEHMKIPLRHGESTEGSVIST